MNQKPKHTKPSPNSYAAACGYYNMYDGFGGSAQASQSAAWSRTLTEHRSLWITDGSGNACTERSRRVNKYLAYMPPDSYRDGESFIDQRGADGHDIRFKFTGKERDSETGFDYFGARYYSSDLSVWLSVDPLASKYPSMSSYMYTAGNPIMLVDPDGMAPRPFDPFEKCASFGGISFKWLKRFFKGLVWHKVVTKTKVRRTSQQTIRPRWNRGTRKRFRIRGNGQVRFETAQIEDQLIIINRKTRGEVVNSGSVGTDGSPLSYTLRRGKYRLIVNANTNPNQNSDNTWYRVTLNDQAYRIKRIRIKKLWGFIPYGWERTKNPWRQGTPPTGQRKQKSNRKKGF